MASFNLPTTISPAGPDGHIQYGIATLSTGDSFGYIDIKTDIPSNIPSIMVMFEAVGYAYAAQQAIRSSWSFHRYANTTYSVGLHNCYLGLDATGVYVSADGYMCLKASVSSTYFIGLTINAYVTTTGSSEGRKIGVLNISTTSNAGNVF